MTRRAAEVVEASIDAFNRRDMPALLDAIDPNVEWVPLRAVLDGDVYRGHEGIRRFIGDMDEDIEHMQLRVDEVFELGDHVLVHGAILGKGRGSGMDLEFPLGWVIGVQSERVVYLRAYTEREDALRAAREAQAGVAQPLGRPPVR